MDSAKSLCIAAMLFVALLVPVAQGQEAAQHNLNMDQVESSAKLPIGWKGRALHGSVSVIHDPSDETNHYIQLQTESGGMAGATYPLSVPEGTRRIDLLAKVKVEELGDRGVPQLQLSLFKDGKFIASRVTTPLAKTEGWIEVSQSMRADGQPDRVSLMAMVQGDVSKVLIDDFRISFNTFEAEKDKEFDAGSKITKIPSDAGSVAKLQLLGQVWGFAKYHHPTILDGQVNWDYELFRLLPKYLEAESSEKRSAVLVTWIEGLGTYESHEGAVESSEVECEILPDLRWLDGLESAELKDCLNALLKARRPVDSFYVELPYPLGGAVFHENPYAQFPYPDAGFRLLSLYRYWNMIQYYAPYRTLTDKDWNEVLPEFIPRFLQAKNATEYMLAVAELVAALQDGHAVVTSPPAISKIRGVNQGVLQVRFIGEQLVVTDYVDEYAEVREKVSVGDVITLIGDTTVAEWVAKTGKYYAASTPASHRLKLARDVLRTNDEWVSLTVCRGDRATKISIPAHDRSLISKAIFAKEEAVIWRVLDGKVGYINPASEDPAEVRLLPGRVFAVDALVVDLRGYPSALGLKLADLLLPNESQVSKATRPVPLRPGAFAFLPPVHTYGGVGDRHFEGKVAILVGPGTVSRSEHLAMILRLAPQARVFGSQTAGANGNVVSVELPGNVGTYLSSLGVHTPEGKCTQRVGVSVDVEVQPTLAGIQAGKDEVMDAALEWINIPDE